MNNMKKVRSKGQTNKREGNLQYQSHNQTGIRVGGEVELWMENNKTFRLVHFYGRGSAHILNRGGKKQGACLRLSSSFNA